MPRFSFDPIAYLIRHQFPNWPLVPTSLASPRRTRFDHGEAKRLSEEVAAFKAGLMEKSPAELDELVAKARQAAGEKARDKAESEERERFFNLPSARANFEHYCKCAYWAADEAIALSLGRQPTIVNWTSVAQFTRVSKFAHAYELRRDLVMRAIGAQQLFDRMAPTVFLSWAKSTGIEVAPELIERAVESGISLTGWKDLYEQAFSRWTKEATTHRSNVERLSGIVTEYASKIEELKAEIEKLKSSDALGKPDIPLGSLERENLQLLAFIGAVRGYGYDPDRRTNAVPTMEQQTDALGRRYTDDSIRKQLHAALQFIPPNWRDRLGIKPNSGTS